MKNVNKWTLEDVRAIVVEVAKREQEYEFLEKMEIAYNGRLSRTLARCLTEITRRNGVTVETRPFKLEFGKTILNVETKEALEQTVLHEVAHAIANKKYKDNCGHDERFKMVCEKIGCIDSGAYAKVYTDEIKKAGENSTWKYTITCKNCGNVYGYKRMNSTLKAIRDGFEAPCYCGKCKCDDFAYKQLR